MELSTLWRPVWLVAAVFAFAPLALAQYSNPVTITGNFVDIQTTGTAVTGGDDVLSPTIDITASGFSFPYYGTGRTAFKMSSNGFVTFNTAETSSGSSNNTLPNTSTPNALVAPFWDDLDVDGMPNAQQDYLVDTANNRLIIQWTNVGRFSSATGSLGDLTFQIHLYGDGTVEYHYGSLVDPGVSYTVGLENDGGTQGQLRIVNGSGVAVASGFGVRFSPTTAPVLFAFQRTYNFPNAGACTGFTRIINFTVSNQGGSPLTLTGATVAGSAAFGVNTPTVGGTATPFPITLAPGASAIIPVTFNPTSTQTEVLNGSVTLNSDGGTVVFDLSGTADAEGAGFAFRSSLSSGACGNTVAIPGTALVPLTNHTRITTWTSGTGDDGRFNLALGTGAVAAFPRLRLFGTDYTTLGVLSNGLVSTSTSASTTFYGALPSSTSAPTIQVAAMNLTVASTVAADNTGEFGAPGVFYGLSDVNGDDVQELVITWWHAYDLGSTPGAAGQYLTAQLIIYKAARANEEDTYEIRFPDGNDANNVPYRQNTGVADGTADVSIENDAVTGIAEPAGVEAAIYRLRNGTAGSGSILGGTLYAPSGGSLGVRFEAETQSVAQGQAGWRMMGMPVRSATVARLAGLNLVQSVANQYPSVPDDNVYLFNGSAYVAATSTTDALPAGRGFLWYLFNLDCDPRGLSAPVCVAGSTPASSTDGTSRSYALPMKLQGTGAEPATVLGSVTVALTTVGDGYNLVANPFRDDLDISNLGSFATGGTLASAVPQVWDPNTGASGSYVNVSGSVAAWQGFFIQTTPGSGGATQLSFPQSARNSTGTFIGRTGAPGTDNPAQARIAFELTSTLPSGETAFDRAATLVFADGSTPEWDLLDASKLTPLASAYATVAFQGVGFDGAARVKAQESRPIETASFAVPMVVDAVGTAPQLTLAWAGLDRLPSTWTLSLRDLVTGTVVDLRTAPSYTFEHAAGAALTLSQDDLLRQTTTASQAFARTAPRFELAVSTGHVVAGEGDAPTAFALDAARPNPTAGLATVRFAMPQAGAVSVAVYDLLGRRVATLAEGEMAAGWHTASLDAARLSAGLYVVRMQAGTFAATQRVTVVR